MVLKNEIICQEQLKDPVLEQIRQMRFENNKKGNIEYRQSRTTLSNTKKI